MTGWNNSDAAHLMELGIKRRTVDNQIRAQVAFMRQSGCPWSVIGESLGVTKQAAQRKYASVRVSLEDRPLPIGGD